MPYRLRRICFRDAEAGSWASIFFVAMTNTLTTFSHFPEENAQKHAGVQKTESTESMEDWLLGIGPKMMEVIASQEVCRTPRID